MITASRSALVCAFIVPIVFTTLVSKAQTAGCPDPAALNYSPAATTNDGSCTYGNAFVNPVLKANLNSKVNESSGLLYWNGEVWTHNDSGGEPALYEIDSATGQIKRTVILANATNVDWEDIAQDDDYIYIGDFGNNTGGNRTDLKIYRVSKSDVASQNSVTDSVISFSFSDQTDFTPKPSNTTNYDCEALIAYNDSLFLFSKDWTDNKTRLYKLPKTPGTYTAALAGELDVQGLVTGADIIADRRVVILTGYTNLLSPFLYLLYDFSGTRFFDANKRKVTVNENLLQMEGIGAVSDTRFFISNERFQKSIFTTLPMLQSVDLSSFLTPYYSAHTVLPVSGLHLNATRQTPQRVLLSWYTLTETNSRGYGAERSSDGRDFQTLPSHIPAKGTGSGKTTYTLADTSSGYRTCYYRVREEDNNGRIAYSNVAVVPGINDGTFSLYPNPASHTCTVKLPANYPATRVSLTLYASSGAVAYHREHLNLSGSTWQMTSLSMLAPGTYTLVADNGIEKLYSQLTVVR